jgi:putative endonuclease
MFYVYILQSLAKLGAIYIGSTSNLKTRLKEHNSGSQTYSKRHAPWRVETYMAFSQKDDAEKFEKYLKSNSGKALRLLPALL